MTFYKKEVIDILKSWFVITLVFTIARGFSTINLISSAIGVGVGFVFHELAHKFTAQKYGLKAHYQAFNSGLWFSLLFSFFGVVLIAPGAVMIPNMNDKIRAGRIASSGPLANIILAVVFFALNYFFTSQIFSFSSYINAFLAMFNLIPFFMFDGKKVYDWNKKVYTLMAVFAVGMVILNVLPFP